MNWRAFFLIHLCTLAVAHAAEPPPTVTWNAEAGVQSSLRESDSRWTRSRPYFEPALLAGVERRGLGRRSRASYEFKASFRAWGDFNERLDGKATGDIEPRDLNVSMAQDFFKLTLGYQEVSWGETFGFQILDLVNGRDLSDPLILDTGWIRRPAPLVNLQFFTDRSSLQLLANPAPSLHRFPRPDSQFDPAAGAYISMGQDYLKHDDQPPGEPEYGARASYLLPFGVDLGLIHYRHYNRNAVFVVAPGVLNPLELRPVAERVQSTGLSASYALDRFVFRGDVVHHDGQPLVSTAPGEVVLGGSQLRTVAGVDFTYDDLALGFQYQGDFNRAPAPVLNERMSWLSARMMVSFFERKFEPELFVFHGLDNQDVWIQPKLAWNIGSASQLSLRYDHISADATGNGILGVVRDEDRYLLWFTTRL
jgi:hypothetical protein